MLDTKIKQTVSFSQKVISFFHSPIWHLFVGEGWGNSLLFFINISMNFFAALMEGLSFGFILLAFQSLNVHSIFDFNFIPDFLKTFIEAKILTHEASYAFIFFVILAICSQACRSGFGYFSQYMIYFLTLRIQTKAQFGVYEQILRMSYACVNKYKIGDLMKYTEAPSTFIIVIMNNINTFLNSLFIALALLVFMFHISSTLTLFALSLFLLFSFYQKVIIQKIAGFSIKLTTAITEFNKHIVQTLYGIKIVHIYNRQKYVFKNVSDILNDIVTFSKKANVWHCAIPALNEVGGIIIVGTVLITGGYILSSAKGHISIPLLLTFVGLSYRFSSRVQVILSSLGGLACTLGYILRLNYILRNDDKEFYQHSSSLDPKNFISLEFRNVSICYDNQKRAALRDFNCIIKQGETVALAGPSGAGKTTTINLILRLYEPTSGELFLNAKPLKDFSIEKWRDLIGVVPQDTYLFNESILENIRFGNLEATKEEIIKASKASHAHEFIMKFPEQYDTIVGEKGMKLSGGEAQRVSLARALIRNPQVLILDEATSNLDSYSEKFIHEALDSFMGIKTIILIAHRLSTVMKADKILVLREGSLLECGSHQQLIKNENSIYSLLWNLQTSDMSSKGHLCYDTKELL